MARQSRLRAQQTRQDIIARALDLASVEGLDGLTIGRLADALFMSKSGLFAHFGSKEELQLAVVDAARDVFAAEVLAGAGDAAGGLDRLAHLASAWLGYVEKGVLRGGCFFAAVSSEVDDRPGRVRDKVVDLTRAWMEALEVEAAEAVAASELTAETDPSQLAFEIHAFVQEANWAFQLHGDAAAFRRAARAIDRSLRQEATDAGIAAINRRGAPR
ncbi:MAG: TetR/AcrR family transcriptional regulator [Candidatus Binatia bacterium]